MQTSFLGVATFSTLLSAATRVTRSEIDEVLIS